MYVIHASNTAFEEYEDKDLDLDRAKEKKISKLITQIKTQKIIHPDIHISKNLRRLNEFKKGHLADFTEGLMYDLEIGEDYFYIEKQFTDARYITIRYFAEEKDGNYYEHLEKIRAKAGEA